MSDKLLERLGRVLIVGGGSMGSAVCAGLCRMGRSAREQVTVANPGSAKRERLASEFGVRTVQGAADGMPAETVIVAVKPNVVAKVCEELARAGLGEGTVVVSLAAGVSTRTLEQLLGSHVQVVRVMPNTPLLVGCGTAGICGGGSASAEALALVEDLFNTLGTAVVVDEVQMDAVTAISGSGPAYFELVAHTMAQAGEELGLDYSLGVKLALGTMRGTAAMLEQTQQDLQEAIEAVSSPGGTTVAALREFESCGLAGAVKAGVKAAARRSAELGS